MVERHCRVARLIAERVGSEAGIEVLNDVVLNQLLLRFGDDRDAERNDRLTQATIARIQSDGICFAGGAKWRGRQVMRLSVCSWYTTEAEGAVAADAIIAAWRAVRPEAAASA